MAIVKYLSKIIQVTRVLSCLTSTHELLFYSYDATIRRYDGINVSLTLRIVSFKMLAACKAISRVANSTTAHPIEALLVPCLRWRRTAAMRTVPGAGGKSAKKERGEGWWGVGGDEETDATMVGEM